MPGHLTILLVDDNEQFRKDFAAWFMDRGHQVVQVADSDSALTLFQRMPNNFDLAIVDYSLQGEVGDGIELLKKLRQIRENLPVIVVTGYGDREVNRRALQAGAYWYLDKPLDLVETEVLVGSVARWRVTTQRLQSLQAAGLHPFIAVSNALFTAKNVPELLKAVQLQAPAFLGADECTIVREDVDTGRFKPIPRDKPIVFSRHFIDRLLSKELVHSGGYRIVSNVSTEPGIDPNLINSGFGAFGASACPPVRGAPAVLYAYFRNPLTEEQRLKLELTLIALARVAGIAIERLRQTELMQALVETSKELLEARSEEKVYQIVAGTIQKHFEVSTFYLSLYDEHTNTISFPLAFDKGQRIEIPPRPMTEREAGLSGYIIREKKEFESANLSEDRNLPVPPILVGDEEQPKSYFGLPLLLPDGKAIGALSIQRYVPRQFLEPAKDALRTLAAQLAVALDRLSGTERLEHVLGGLVTRPLMEILEEIAEGVKSDTGADIVVVHPYDASRRAFTRERIRLGLPDEKARSMFSGSEIQAFEHLLEKGEHFAAEAATDEIFSGDFAKEYGVVSSGGIALKAGERQEPVGVLVVNYRTPHPFTHEDRETIRRFGQQQAAVALHIYWLREQDRRAELRRHAEYQAIQATRQSKDRGQLIRGVITAIQQAWQGVAVVPSLLFVDRANRRLDFSEAVRDIYKIDIPAEEKRTFIQFGEGICGWVAETGQSLLVQDTANDDRYLKLISTTQSELCVPIKLGNSLLGVLNVEAPEKNFFQDADRIFLEHVADELAIALAAAGEREHAKKVTDAAIEAARTPAKGLDILTQRAHEIAGLTGGEPTSTTVFLSSGNGLELVSAYPPTVLEGIRQTIGSILPLDPPQGKRRGIVVRAAIEKKSQVVHNVEQDRDYICYEPKTQAELAVPILAADGTVLGVLNVEYADPEALSEEDKNLLEALADQTSIITVLVQQARQLADTQQANAEATALAFMGMGALDYGHRWKNAAATVAETAKLLKNHFQPTVRTRRGMVRRALTRLGLDVQKVEGWIERISQTVSDVQESALTTKPDEQVECIAVNEWLEELTARWRKREPEIQFTLELNTGADDCVKANRNWLTSGVDNLVANAVRAAYNNSTPHVILRSTRGDRLIRIEVEDNGPGVPETVQPYLFITTVPASAVGRAGRGMGCLEAKFIARVYGGRAFLMRTDSTGTTVALELPVA